MLARQESWAAFAIVALWATGAIGLLEAGEPTPPWLLPNRISFIPSDEQAATNPPDGQTALTLADLEAIASANNPALQQAAAAIEVARGRRTQAGLYPNPVLSYVGGEMGIEGHAGQQGAFLSQEFVTAGKRRLDRAVASQDLSEVLRRAEAQRLRVMNAVRVAYYEALAAQQRVELADQLLSVVQDAERIAGQRLAAEEVARPDVLQAQIELERARIVAENARSRYDAVWRRLTAALGTPDMQPTPLAGSLIGALPEFQWEESLQAVLAGSPELKAARARLRRARLALRRAKAEPIPNITVRGGAQYDFGTRDAISTVEIGVPLPVFDRNQGNIQAAHGALHHADNDVRRVELALRERLAGAFQSYQSSRQQAERYYQRILPKARETAELTTEGYRLGEFGFVDVLTAQRTFFETSLSYLDALSDLWRSVVELRGLLLSDGLAMADASP